MITFRTRTGNADHDWNEVERQLKYIVRLVGWMIKARAEGVVTCAELPLCEAIERFEHLVVQAASRIQSLAGRDAVSALVNGDITHFEAGPALPLPSEDRLDIAVQQIAAG